MDTDLFARISRTAKFDKKRFSEDIALFEPHNEASNNTYRGKKGNDSSDNELEEQIKLLEELDFFQNGRQALINCFRGLSNGNSRNMNKKNEVINGKLGALKKKFDKKLESEQGESPMDTDEDNGDEEKIMDEEEEIENDEEEIESDEEEETENEEEQETESDEEETENDKEEEIENDEEIEDEEEDKDSDQISDHGNENIINEHESSPLISTFENKEEVQEFRKKHRIRIYGTDIPNPFRTFEELVAQYEIKPYLQKNLRDAGYKQPTPVQMQSVPITLHKRDLMATAPTGSGKTLAYILPIMHDLKGPEKSGYRALIISPTRELARQIYREIKKMSIGKKFKVCMLTKTSAAVQAQAPHLRQKFDILVSTPLRLVHAIKQEHIQLKNVCHLVLDEADKLLELGFLEQVDEILAACSNPRLLKSLYSATLPSGVESLANTIMKDPIRVVIGTKNAATETVNQKLVFVGQEEGKLIAIRQLIQQGLKPPVLIFVQSIERAKELFHELIYDGINVDVIHSERTKAQRDAVIQNFMQCKIWVLIATDLMARGIDFKGVNLVINYDFPQSVQSYIHRIGRTGRAGRRGDAVTYFTKDDSPFVKSVVNVMKDSGCEVPDWMLSLKNPTKEAKKKLRRKPIERKSVDTRSKYDMKKIKRKRDIIDASKRRKASQQDTNTKSTIETSEGKEIGKPGEKEKKHEKKKRKTGLSDGQSNSTKDKTEPIKQATKKRKIS